MAVRKSGRYACIVLCMLLFSFLPVSAQSEFAFIVEDLYDSEELMPYPILDDGPVHFQSAGTSNEFTCNNEQDADSSNIVVLNWTHIAGTYLEYNTTPSLAVCKEYAYFSQDISWNRDTMPTALNISLYYQVNGTGNFLLDSWPGMYEVQIWFIKHDGTTRVASKFYWGYSGYQYRSSLIDLSSIEEVFSSTSNLGEFQAQLAVVLIPSWRFLDDFGNQPWQYYNGSVVARFKEVHLDALYRESSNPPPIKEPVRKTNWKLGESDRFRDSDLGSDGDLYMITVQESNGVPWGTTLTRVNTLSQIVWQRSWNGTDAIFWRGISVTDSRIYLLGEVEGIPGSNAVLSIYSLDGTYVDQWIFDFERFDFAVDIDSSADDYLYLGLYTNVREERNYIVKVDTEGIVYWMRSFGLYQYDTITSLQVDSQGNIITRTDQAIFKFNNNGTMLWEINELQNEVFVLDDDTAILTSSTGLTTNITRIDEDGNQLWTFKRQMRYTPSWSELFYASWFTEGADGLIYALYSTYGFHTSSIIVIFNREGEQLDNYTVAFANEAYSGIDVERYRRIHITEDNVLYLVGRVMDEDWYYEVTVGIYGAEPLIFGIPTTTFISTVTAVGMIAIAIIYLQFRKHQT